MQQAVTPTRALGPPKPQPAVSDFPLPGQSPYAAAMQGGPFRRLVAALVVVALLIAGFAAASVAVDLPCVMPMAAGMPCDDSHQDNAPDDHKQVPPTLACFAKCPAPILDRVAAPAAAFTFVRLILWSPPHAAPAGIGVVPPLHPPRA